jgi:hypothetical protein
MSEGKQAQMELYFTENIGKCKELEQTLSADGRGDEAIFARVRGNVFDIFQKIFSMSVRKVGTEEEEIRSFFGEKLEEIPAPWRASLEKAQAHGDVEKVNIETIKLDALGEIDGTFRRIWGETL